MCNVGSVVIEPMSTTVAIFGSRYTLGCYRHAGLFDERWCVLVYSAQIWVWPVLRMISNVVVVDHAAAVNDNINNSRLCNVLLCPLSQERYESHTHKKACMSATAQCAP